MKGKEIETEWEHLYQKKIIYKCYFNFFESIFIDRCNCYLSTGSDNFGSQLFLNYFLSSYNKLLQSWNVNRQSYF